MAKLKVKMDRWYEDEGKIYAFWNYEGESLHALGIKGSPMGRGRNDEEAVQDLVSRTNMESAKEILVDDCEVIN